jgi:hypothetical protein
MKASGKKRHRLRVILILAASLAVGFGAGTYMAVVRGLPPVESIAMFNPPVATKIFDQDNIQIGEFFIERRELTNFAEVPDYLKKGFICIEDKLFYQHWGVDIKALLRSLIVNILHPEHVPDPGKDTPAQNEGDHAGDTHRKGVYQGRNIGKIFQPGEFWPGTVWRGDRGALLFR